MLIYNYQKEFVGIDENDLKALGFSDFAHLRNEAADFADFFVRTPGFVHNFKHVHWIDFVTCAESNEDSKVIIHANGKNFRCTLDIRTAYLVDNPDQKAYLIHLMNLRALSHSENEQISGDVLERPALIGSSERKAIFKNAGFLGDNKFTKPQEQDIVIEEEIEPFEENNYFSDDPYETSVEQTRDSYDDSPIDLGDNFLDSEDLVPQEKVVSDVEKSVVVEPEPLVREVQEPQSEKKITQVLNVGADYVYDPHVASDELGLPVDLIEEFIQDFINQANDFKADLYTSLQENNISNLKVLSHKLKGVAANLRVEDALEVLTTINTVEDTEVIETNLNTFYIIIENLSGKPLDRKVKVEDNVEEKEDDDLIISFKDEVEDKKESEAILEAPDFEDSSVSIHKPVKETIKNQDLNDDKLEIDVEDSVELEEKVSLETKEEPKLELEAEVVETESKIEVEPEPEPEVEVEQLPEDIDEVIEAEKALKYEDISYSKSHVANEIGIGLESFNELFDDYMAEASLACKEIERAIENNDIDTWQKNAIKLKGMSDNMRVHDIVAELKSIIHTPDANIARKAIGVVSNKLQQISKVEV